MVKISIVTVCYNAVATIEKTMLSVLNQTYPNVEYIIIDGGSTDGTVDIIKKYADRLAYWVSEPDRGIYDAMNKGIKVATGKWINFMNSGDTFYQQNTIESILPYLSDNKTDIIYGDVNLLYDYGTKYQKPSPLKKICNRMVFCHQSSFTKTHLMKSFSFNTQYKIAADYEFFYKQYQNQRIFVYVPTCIANYSRDGISTKQWIKCNIENGIINGKGERIDWKLFLIQNRIIMHLIKCMHYVLPDSIIAAFRRLRTRVNK